MTQVEQGPDTDASTGLSTQPKDVRDTHISIGFVGWLRWGWRQLTSMRTALLLLFLLAIASVPGSLLPQRGVDPVRVNQFIVDNPGLGGFYDAIGFFEVFTAPWFVAIYLLLCVSLAGCIVPRTRQHWRAMRAQPPAAPSRLSRLARSHGWESTGDVSPEHIIERSAKELRNRRWRVRTSDFDGTTGWVSAEKGYLRETGNLLFHVSILALLVAVGAGSLLGWRGQVVVVEGDSFSNIPTQYDSFESGALVDRADLPPFSFTLDDFSADYQREGQQRGAPTEFSADLTFKSSPESEPQNQTVGVNAPLRVDGANAFLVGHGYAPVIQVKDAQGKVVYDSPTIFLPADGNFGSNGVVKMPDTDPQLGLQAIFLPTAVVDDERGPISTFPAPDDPALFFSVWEGNLGLDNGVPQSVYKLDTAQMERTGLKALRPGESWELPNGRGTVTLTGFKEYATFDIAHDPGKLPALAAAALAILGLILSLFIARRRVWVRVSAQPGGAQRVEVAGLSRTDEAGLGPVVDDVAGIVKAIAPQAGADKPNG